MNLAVAVVLSLVAMLSLYLFTFLISFYHCFDPNRESFDKYAVMTIVAFALIFCVSFAIVCKWYNGL